MTSPADTSEKPSTIDRLVQAWQARFTGDFPRLGGACLL